MIHFFRHIRMQLLTNNKISKYLLYALGEIFLVVIGILIALQINNWNNSKLNRKEELKIYENIKQQIQEDRRELSEMKAFNRYQKEQLDRANILIMDNNRRAIDTLAFLVMMMSQYSDFNGNDNIHETLVNSGDLKIIKNDTIPVQIKKLENTYNYVNRLEELHWSIMMEELSPEMRGVMNYNSFEMFKPDRIREPDKLYSPEIQNIIYEVRYLSMGKDSIYGRALRQIDRITGLIDNELGIDTISKP